MNKPVYELICMAFDGEYQTEGEFDTVESAWNRSVDMGSRWFFYPFHFVVKDGVVVDSMDLLEHLIGDNLKQVAAHFMATSKDPRLAGADVDIYAMSL